jgi:hypothetical protein
MLPSHSKRSTAHCEDLVSNSVTLLLCVLAVLLAGLPLERLQVMTELGVLWGAGVQQQHHHHRHHQQQQHCTGTATVTAVVRVSQQQQLI